MDEVIEKPPAIKQDPKFKDFLNALMVNKPEEITPDNYAIVIHNDDVTPVEYVVLVLREVFAMPKSRAIALMLAAHHEGKAIICILSENEAKVKFLQAKSACMSFGCPNLTFTMEKE